MKNNIFSPIFPRNLPALKTEKTKGLAEIS